MSKPFIPSFLTSITTILGSKKEQLLPSNGTHPIILTKHADIILAALICTFLGYIGIRGYEQYGPSGGGDTYHHYLIARYAFTHPLLLLDQWGKPVFTLIAAPFAQAGLWGVIGFNLVILGMTSVMTARIISEKPTLRMIAVGFFFLSPITLSNSISALTEPLCGFTLLVVLWYCKNKKFFLAAIVCSILPLIRTEAGLFLFVLAGHLFLIKQWKAIPFLGSGIIVFALLGGIATGDFAWMLTHNAYIGNPVSALYGSGPLGHYVRNLRAIWGSGIVILAVIGTTGTISQKLQRLFSNDVCFLAFAFAAVFFVAHSIAWKLEGLASAGYLRYMVSITPCLIILAGEGLKDLITVFRYRKIQVVLCALLLVAVTIYDAKYCSRILPRIHDEVLFQKQAGDFLEKIEAQDKRIVFWNPYFAYRLNLDPYGESASLLLRQENPDEILKKADIVVWDSHFAHNEGGTDSETVKALDLPILLSLTSEDLTLGGIPYMLVVFGRK